ncbi:MAG: hypothetical protein AAGD05_07295, partial [Bacteroidota bacterium]
AQMANTTQQNCSDHEHYTQSFESRKAAIEAERINCLAAADNYKKDVKQKAKQALQQVEEEISTLELAMELAEERYVQLLAKLKRENTQNRKQANSKAQKIQIKKEYEQALSFAKENHERTLKELESRITEYRVKVVSIKAQRTQQLTNAEQQINALKVACERDYQQALEALELGLNDSKNQLEEKLELLRIDSSLFVQNQAEALAAYETNAATAQNEFLQKQKEQNQAFVAKQATILEEFERLLNERRNGLNSQKTDCLQGLAQQEKWFDQQRVLVQDYVWANLAQATATCRATSSEMEANFLAKQAADKVLLQKEHDKQRQQFEGRQDLQRQHLVSDLMAANTGRKRIFVGQTKNLYQALTNKDLTLQEGHQYELRVRAIDPLGIAQFANKGWSDWWPLKWKVCSPSVLVAPVALAPTQVATNSFTANWTLVEGVEKYLLEVSTDENFQTLVPSLTGVLVEGKHYSAPFYGNTFCYRVRSAKNGALSPYSNVICASVPEECEFNTPCDDGDPCTYNDVYLDGCYCRGINDDVDGDGVCDGLDECPGGDDNIDVDGDSVPDFCDDCIVNMSCDDGNALTYFDHYIINPAIDPNLPPPPGVPYCLCQGIPNYEVPCAVESDFDEDNDGVCDWLDVCPGGDDKFDVDNDGVPDDCDICPDGDDNIDNDNDGVPDACDNVVGDCRGEVMLCPEELSSKELCTYRLPLDPYCFTRSIRYRLPGSSDILRLSSKSQNNPNGLFTFWYCNRNTPCDLPYIDSLVVHLNEWFDLFGYEGEADYIAPSLKDPFGYLMIYDTDIEFLSSVQWCGFKETKVFQKTNCHTVSVSILHANLIGYCESPTYLWSNGNIGPSINITGPASQYSVTITCDDGCVYTSTANAACVVGAPCNDYNPCTLGDRYTDCCGCQGDPQPDSDGDGVCDPIDVCPGLDDSIMPDENNDGVADECYSSICPIGAPCDDGDRCTVNDVYNFSDARGCYCEGEGPFDSDGDFVCDALDVCPGYPDYADTDLDGIPDGCDNICVSAAGEELDYCEAIPALAACVSAASVSDADPRLKDMGLVSNMLVEMIRDAANFVNNQTTNEGTPIEDLIVETLTDGDLTVAFGPGFD